MFDIKVLASSSAGNCYIISDGITRLLLDAGVKIKDILVACDFNMDTIRGALITHEHNARSGAPDVVLEVMLDAPGIAHAAGGNNDTGPFWVL